MKYFLQQDLENADTLRLLLAALVVLQMRDRRGINVEMSRGECACSSGMAT
jgi:hypothetical protein